MNKPAYTGVCMRSGMKVLPQGETSVLALFGSAKNDVLHKTKAEIPAYTGFCMYGGMKVLPQGETSVLTRHDTGKNDV